MTTPVVDIPNLKAEAETTLATVKNATELEAWRVKYVGRKGLVPQLLRNLKDLALEDKRILGPQAQTLRQELEAAYKNKWEQYALTNDQKTTVTVSKPGTLHPLTLTARHIQDIFLKLGFTYVEGPLVEDPANNFDRLNIPPEHPARAETDTFYVEDGHILRTHVSTLQVRGPLEQGVKPPYKMFYLGRCFRAERTDATHETTFHQFEFMVVDEKSTLAYLKVVIETFYSEFFSKKVTARLRPAYFPFVEPGLEVDLSCIFCEGKGCRVCKYTGWIEMAGAGMVHPNVLKAINLDPTRYQGYALGGALDRLAMLRFNVNDIRDFWTGDITFISKFHATAV